MMAWSDEDYKAEADYIDSEAAKARETGSPRKVGEDGAGGELWQRLVALQLAHETKYSQLPSGQWAWSCACGDSAESFKNWDECHRRTREHWASVIILALSLSSPIEQRGEIYQLGFKTLAAMIRFQFPDFDENHVSESLARIAARPTSQASSEIREALRVAHLYILRNDRWSEPVLCRACLKSAMLAKDIQHVEDCLYVRIEALLAPSRQGAAKRVEG